ncbi:MAG: hypothetical protein ACKO96_39460, partial [Flammeovirgaceae bacterium]
GLALDTQRMQEDIKPNVKGTLYNNRKGVFALTPAAVRPITDGDIHDTVYERIKEVTGYKPPNIKQT